MGENLLSTGAVPQQLVPEPAATALGRSVMESKSKLVSCAVRMLKGRPELTSMMGATVKPEKTPGRKPEPSILPVIRPLLKTPERTKRWRWSKCETERSALGLKLFGGASAVETTSVASSMACDQV